MEQWSKDLIAVDQAVTLDGLFLHRVRRSPEREAYRWFDRANGAWRSLSWAEIAAQAARWRQALAGEGLKPGDRVALLLRNCPEWVMFDQAALSLGLVTVPLYTDDRAENAAYILRDCAARVLLVQDAYRWKRLAEVMTDGRWPARVVLLDTSKDARALAAKEPAVVVASDWLPSEGAIWHQRAAGPNELASIVYTSGTTGKPKGVMLTHGNILSNVQGALTLLDVYQEDVFLSFLPLSHMLERTASYYLPMMAGSTLAYARSVTQLAEDLKNVRPTVIIAVPRVFERVYQRLHEQIRQRPAPTRWLFDLARHFGWVAFEHAQGRRRWHPLLLLWPVLRRLVADKVLERLGGRIRAAVSGGAPLPPEVARLFLGLGLPLIQGYGLTETSPVVSVNPLEDNRPETVGIPLGGVQVRISELDELLVSGPGVMRGYWNNQAATAQVLGKDGWFRTGDQARLVGRHIQITGRLKDILVLSNGEKVPPADMEMAIALDPLFEQAMVLGEGKPFLSALLVLNADLWPSLARDFQLDPQDPASLNDQGLIKAMLARVRKALADFPGYAKIRRVTLALEPWSIDNGLLTPTMKVKRHQVVEQHRNLIERMYALDG
ncbi:AMP-dependent synthetase/ligase [Thiorhodovibrio frisius]|uniref:AMP-forming long-chain acyl-CoA synthetase n=1 Tax=Thiorhodovibrio frisius TaxID=631362 RepID=H8Z1I3_9GAMM|nr:AMP-dependent synthetase/ligase [Thiorhodovibrio frisius]EIC22532.1 AMP-forming long-chain acyl-CoA synthetase [Thiorhodovibrio frisius]WPL19971.1 Long-chain-fatty-acid--CoA ligase FadD15 [Thiorhodovibrio frisius]